MKSPVVNLVRLQLDRLGAVVAVVAGVVALVAGWLGASRSIYTVEQIPFVISGGLGAVFLIGVGATLWISADLRDEWRQLRRLEEILTGEADNVADPVAAPAPAATVPGDRSPAAGIPAPARS